MIQENRGISTRVVKLLGALIFATLPGCVSLPTDCPAVTGACLEKCESTPRFCRGNVHVFVVNGFDPLDIGGTGELRTTLNRLGFKKVYTGQFYHARGFTDDIRDVAAADPSARFVIVGVGAGTDAAVSLAESVLGNGVLIDLLVSVDSPFWSDAAGKRPINVQRIMAVHGWPATWLPRTPSPERDITLPDYGWFGVSTDPLTVEALAWELATVATTIPPIDEERLVVIDDSPVPRRSELKSAKSKHVVSYLDPATALEGREVVSEAEPAMRPDIPAFF
jgi:hypothetical protein